MIRKDTIKKQLSRKYYSESKKRRYFKEGAGSGVLIQVPHLEGDIVSVEKDNKDCIAVTLENVKMEDCTLNTYYIGSHTDGTFTNGKVIFYIDSIYDDSDDSEELSVDDVLGDIALTKFECDDITISHGGGWSHASLEGNCNGEVYSGLHYEWRDLFSNPTFAFKAKNGNYYYDCDVEEIDFNFGSQIEDYYQYIEDYHLHGGDEDEYVMDENHKKSSAITKRIKQYKENMMDDRDSDSLSVSAIDAIIKEIRSKHEDMFDTISTRGNEIVMHLNNVDAELHITTAGNNCDAYLVTFLNNKKVETKRDVQRFVNDVIKTVEDMI